MELQQNDNSNVIPILLYIPVLHNGYLQFFGRHSKVSQELWIIGEDIAAQFSSSLTEIRAMNSACTAKMIQALNIFRTIRVLSLLNVGLLQVSKIITAQETISRKVTEKYFPGVDVVIDTTFLRYDEGNVKSSLPVNYDRKSEDLFDRQMMKLAFDEAGKSSDWWRHVGAVLVKDRKIISVAYNRPIISEHIPYAFGNPRDFVEAGTLGHFSDTLHAEKALFAPALKGGIRTEGSDVYLSVFPCPDCAKLMACYGIKRCFFASGNAYLDSEKVLRSVGIELVYVPFTQEQVTEETNAEVS